MDNRNKPILRWEQRMLRETMSRSMCHAVLTRTREVVEVLEEAIPMVAGELEAVVVVTRMGGTNLMTIPVEMVTKGTTTTTEEGVVELVEEMAIHTTTTKTLMLLLRLSF